MKSCDCETCPLSWEDRGYEGDCDCGCVVYGDLYGNKPICHMLDSIKYSLRKCLDRKRDKELEHEYDGIVEWFENLEKENGN